MEMRKNSSSKKIINPFEYENAARKTVMDNPEAGDD
jgi:hypothetical protein